LHFSPRQSKSISIHVADIRSVIQATTTTTNADSSQNQKKTTTPFPRKTTAHAAGRSGKPTVIPGSNAILLLPNLAIALLHLAHGRAASASLRRFSRRARKGLGGYRNHGVVVVSTLCEAESGAVDSGFKRERNVLGVRVDEDKVESNPLSASSPIAQGFFASYICSGRGSLRLAFLAGNGRDE